MTAFFTGTALGRNLAALGLAVLAILAAANVIFRSGKKAERANMAERQAKANQEVNERIDHAPTLRDASDADRSDWLRDFAARNGN